LKVANFPNISHVFAFPVGSELIGISPTCLAKNFQEVPRLLCGGRYD